MNEKTMATVVFYNEDGSISDKRKFSSRPAAEFFLSSMRCSDIDFDAKITEEE